MFRGVLQKVFFPSRTSVSAPERRAGPNQEQVDAFRENRDQGLRRRRRLLLRARPPPDGRAPVGLRGGGGGLRGRPLSGGRLQDGLGEGGEEVVGGGGGEGVVNEGNKGFLCYIFVCYNYESYESDTM